MSNNEVIGKLAVELYSKISTELKEKGLTEEVLNAINTLINLLTASYY